MFRSGEKWEEKKYKREKLRENEKWFFGLREKEKELKTEKVGKCPRFIIREIIKNTYFWKIIVKIQFVILIWYLTEKLVQIRNILMALVADWITGIPRLTFLIFCISSPLLYPKSNKEPTHWPRWTLSPTVHVSTPTTWTQ